MCEGDVFFFFWNKKTPPARKLFYFRSPYISSQEPVLVPIQIFDPLAVYVELDQVRK